MSTAPLVLVLTEDQAMALSIHLLEMATVTMDLTMMSVCWMEQIAVGLMLIQIIAHYVNALKEAAIRVGLLTDIAMMSTTMKSAPLMEEIVVDPT